MEEEGEERTRKEEVSELGVKEREGLGVLEENQFVRVSAEISSFIVNREGCVNVEGLNYHWDENQSTIQKVEIIVKDKPMV